MLFLHYYMNYICYLHTIYIRFYILFIVLYYAIHIVIIYICVIYVLYVYIYIYNVIQLNAKMLPLHTFHQSYMDPSSMYIFNDICIYNDSIVYWLFTQMHIYRLCTATGPLQSNSWLHHERHWYIYTHHYTTIYIYIYGIAQRNGWWDTKIDWVTGPSSTSGCQTFSTSRLACLFLPGLGQRDQFRKHGTVWVSSQTHKNQIKAHYSFTLLGWSRTCIYIYIYAVCCFPGQSHIYATEGLMHTSRSIDVIHDTVDSTIPCPSPT